MTTFGTLFAALALLASPEALSNITDRVTAERTARLEKRSAITSYQRHMEGIARHRAHSTGGGELSELADMEHAVPRMKGMADIEEQGLKETPEERRLAAFCEAFAPVLALSDDEAKRFVAHLAKPGDDLGKSDPPLFERISSTAFQSEQAAALAKYGCGHTQFVFTYPTAKKLKKLRRAIAKRLGQN